MTTRQAVLTRLIESIVGISSDRPVRVAVDGPDAAGKTTLADELAAALSGIRPAIRASVDDYIRPADERPQSPGVPAAGYFDDNFDLAALVAGYLIPLGPGGDRSYRAADGSTGIAPYDAVLLVDGVFLLQERLRPHWDVGIYCTSARTRCCGEVCSVIGTATAGRTPRGGCSRRSSSRAGARTRLSMIRPRRPPS
ncbi:nucleoside/nucleotide kinase family protein [Kribbella jiaozuonensis]|uniref:Uridylate kinase n=1 Tax=Kribbella jiaozuonensis TaxID=2575441 RepID=A0A4U3LYH5_9ACTN|nr:uridylate kinase [Kribbella jiaozuonensis]TKK81355.1 uridylate kinase [Kribbella jiaozuonensis]